MKVVFEISGPFTREEAEEIAEGMKRDWRNGLDDPLLRAIVEEHIEISATVED